MHTLPLVLVASTASNGWTCAGIAVFSIAASVTLGIIARRARTARVWP